MNSHEFVLKGGRKAKITVHSEPYEFMNNMPCYTIEIDGRLAGTYPIERMWPFDVLESIAREVFEPYKPAVSNE